MITPRVVVNACNPRIWEEEAGAQGHPQAHRSIWDIGKNVKITKKKLHISPYIYIYCFYKGMNSSLLCQTIINSTMLV